MSALVNTGRSMVPSAAMSMAAAITLATHPEKPVLRSRPEQHLILLLDREICIESSKFSPFGTFTNYAPRLGVSSEVWGSLTELLLELTRK